MKNFEQDIREAAREKLEQLKKVFEELEVQLSLGKKEAQETFEREKKNFQEFVEGQRERFKAEEEKVTTLRQELLARLEALRAALQVAAPEESEAYNIYKDKLLQNVYALEGTMKEAYEVLRFRLREQLDQFKAKLDAYRIQLALSDFDKKDSVDEKRKALEEAITATIQLFKEEERRGDKLETFTEEVSASFEHLRRAFVELFS